VGFLDNILLRRPLGLLYHYTSQAGLIGIVKDKCIWATKAHYQNDAKELLHALELSRGVIETLRDDNPTTEEERLLRAMKLTLNSIRSVNIFVCSFSEHNDMLSQWRGYCPRGNGFSIGLDYEQLKPIVESQGLRFVPCIYNLNEQQLLITELIHDVMASFRTDLSNSIYIKQALRNRANEYANRMLAIAPIIKHSTFSEEREWRAVSYPIDSNHTQVRYREGVSMLTPYFVVNLTTSNTTQLPIKEIIVGPTPHVELSASSVADFLFANNIPINVRPSRIPFRGW
jgi:hypothetical protein